MTIEELKQNLIKRASNQISITYGDLDEKQEALLGQFFDDAISIIMNWKGLDNTNFFLSGRANAPILKYIIRNYNEQGIEGQISSSISGDKKLYKLSPVEELKNSFLQGV